MMQDFWRFLHNLVKKEAYRVIYQNFLLVVVKIDYFSIDFLFYDILQVLFFGIGIVSYVKFSSTIMQNSFKIRYLWVYFQILQVW